MIKYLPFWNYALMNIYRTQMLFVRSVFLTASKKLHHSEPSFEELSPDIPTFCTSISAFWL